MLLETGRGTVDADDVDVDGRNLTPYFCCEYGMEEEIGTWEDEILLTSSVKKSLVKKINK
jgi:hypothetical protein